MSFLIRNKTGGTIVLNDIGLSIPPNSDFDLTSEQPNDIAMSDDLVSAIQLGNIVVLDPIGGSPHVELNAAQSEEVVRVHNDPHYRIRGGTLNQLEDVDLTGAQPGDLLVLGGSPSGIYVVTPPQQALANTLALNDLSDVTAPGSPQGTFDANEVYVFVGNGTGVDIQPLFGGSPQSVIPGFCETVEDVVGEMIAVRSTHTDISVVYTDGVGTCDGQLEFSVDDVFLRNTGDTLDSGILTIAPGAELIISGVAGSPSVAGTFTIEAGADATISTPAGGFANPNDIINKQYVDEIAAGLRARQSVDVATTDDLDVVTGTTWTYTATGSPIGVGATLTSTPAGSPQQLTIDGIALNVGDRVLVKDQDTVGSPGRGLENGIYTVVTNGVGSPTQWELVRCTCVDESNEVSGSFVLVESGTTYENTGWVLTVDDPGTFQIGVDPIVPIQFSGPGSVVGDVGIAQTGTNFALDLRPSEVTAATPALADRIAFHNVDGAPQGTTGTQTYAATFQSTFDALDVPYSIATDGFVVRTADNTFTSRTIEVEGAGALDGLVITDGDGVSGNPTVGLDIQNLPVRSDVVDVNDRVAVYNSTADANEYYTVGELAGAVASTNSFVNWVGSGNVGSPNVVTADSSSDTVTIIGGDAISLVFDPVVKSVEFSVSNAGLTDTAVTALDSVLFFDADNGDQPEVRSLGSLLEDLNVVTEGNLTASNGVQLVNVGSPQVTDVQLDINGLPSDTIDVNDEIVFFSANGSPANVHRKTTVADFISNLDLNTADIVAADGLEINNVGSPTQQEISLDFFSLPDSAVELNDRLAFANVSGSPQLHISRTVGDFLNDLDVPTLTGVSGFVVVAGSPANPVGRTITAAGVGLLDGLQVTNGDGVAGDPEVGLDIRNTPAAGENFAANDEIVAVNASAGTGSPIPGENQKFTGQQVADGVLAISGLGGLAVTTIGGQEVLTLVDTTRSNKVLSVETSALTWSENALSNNDWLQIGNATDAASGYVVPLDATVVKVMAHTEDDNGNTQTIDLYVDGVNTATVATFGGVSGEDDVTDATLNIDVDAGEKIRLRAGTGGTIRDTVVTIWLKWRG